MIYAIRCGDAVKFGRARNPWARVLDLQIGNPQRLEVVVGVDLPDECEGNIHGWLEAERVRGEWFRGPKTENIVMDLRCRAKCSNPLHPSDMEYSFWDWNFQCGGSCAGNHAP